MLITYISEICHRYSILKTTPLRFWIYCYRRL